MDWVASGLSSHEVTYCHQIQGGRVLRDCKWRTCRRVTLQVEEDFLTEVDEGWHVQG